MPACFLYYCYRNGGMSARSRNGVKKPGKNNNMYAEAKARALNPYAFAIDGSVDAAACVVFADALADEAYAAFRAACKGIGLPDPSFLDAAALGENAGAACDDAAECARVHAAAGRADAPQEGLRAADGAACDAPRDLAKDLFAAVEALDPLMLVVADASAARRLTEAYRESIAPDSHGFAFGRPYAAFSSFQRDLADPRMKQRDWALLKAMRKSAGWLK